jgi:hypothetical protein
LSSGDSLWSATDMQKIAGGSQYRKKTTGSLSIIFRKGQAVSELRTTRR